MSSILESIVNFFLSDLKRSEIFRDELDRLRRAYSERERSIREKYRSNGDFTVRDAEIDRLWEEFNEAKTKLDRSTDARSSQIHPRIF